LRLFVAVPLPDLLQEKLGEALRQVSPIRGIKWVSKFQLHVTLRFIGDLEEGRVAPLLEGLERMVRSFTPFEAEIGGLDAFPRLDRPRILFVPVVKGAEHFLELSKGISEQLEKIGVGPDATDYHAHVTLGRVKEGRDANEATTTLRESPGALNGAWRVDRLVLFQSQLTPQGLLYTRLGEFELGR
jgi:2'-5' RNA ligase